MYTFVNLIKLYKPIYGINNYWNSLKIKIYENYLVDSLYRFNRILIMFKLLANFDDFYLIAKYERLENFVAIYISILKLVFCFVLRELS